MSNTAPLGYKRVEYLESTGTQYIDTGIKPTISQKYEIKYSVSDITTNQVIFGTRTSGIFQTSTNQIYLNINDNKKRFFAGNIVTENDIQINIIQTDIFTANSGNYDSTGTKNFFIFALNNIDTPAALVTARIYSFKIYDNDVLVRDYIPVLNENNVAGLYDLVNKQFYGNSGTGSFQYGNIIQEGTIAEKFNYSLETKELIKDGINYLGGNVTDETTLKEYRDELDSVYNKLPKVSNSTPSDNVILYPTLKGRIDSTLKGQIGQDTTNGNQLINFASKTATGYSFTNDTLVFNSSQQAYANVYWDITSLIRNNPGKKLYFSYEDIDVSNQINVIAQINIGYNDGTANNYIPLLNHDLSHSLYTIPDDTSNIRYVNFGIFSNNSANNTNDYSVTIVKPQLQFGETELPYEKYSGRNIFPKSKL